MDNTSELRQKLKGALFDLLTEQEAGTALTREALYERTGAANDPSITAEYFDGCVAQLVQWRLIKRVDGGFVARRVPA